MLQNLYSLFSAVKIREESTGLRTELKNMNEHEKKALSTLDEITEALLLENDQFAALRTKIEEKKNEIEKLQADLEETQKARKQTAQLLRNEEVLWLRLENDLQDTQGELKKTRPELEKLQTRRANLQKMIEEKSSLLKEKTEALEASCKELQELERLSQLDEKEYVNIRELMILTDEELTKNQILLSEKGNIDKDLERKLAADKETLTRLDQELSETALQVIGLQESITSKENQHALLDQEINALEEAIALPKKENQELNQRLEVLNQDVENKKKYKTRLTERFHELEVLLKKGNENLVLRGEKLDQMDKAETNLKKKIRAVKDSIRTLNGETQAKKAAIEEKKAQILSLKEEYQLALNECDELSSTSEDLNEELAIYDLLIQTRKERLENVTKKKSELQKNVEEKRQRLQPREAAVNN